ncbi:MAG TPA: hypothetical protein VFC51_15920 [Chloroflexota bacterium]|nr:hypothetical protein [Chloroflexota bacterium]
MIEPGEYSDTLRALGHFLDRTGASSIEIVDRGDHWLVASTLGSETLFETYHLADLRNEGRLRRGDPDNRPDSGLSWMLRTLGHVLDTLRATSFGIFQVEEGFRLTATNSAEEIDRTYTLAEIRALNEERRRDRRALEA